MIEDFAVLTPPLIALVRCGLSGSPEAAETLGEIAEPLWPGLLDLAAHHGLLPLLYAGSSAANLTPPVSTAQELQLYAHLAEAHSVMAFRQLEKLLVRCNAAGIKPIVMKGALLAHHYYRTPGLRSFDDLDIVAPLDRRDQLAKLLTDTGYVAEENFFGLDHAWWTEQHYHWFFKSSQGLPVELHWGLTKPGTVIQFDMEALWARSQPVSYHEAQAREFAAEDSLLYLAVHSSKHCFRIPLRNHVDLAILLSKSETLDWEAVLQRSRALGVSLRRVTRHGAAGTQRDPTVRWFLFYGQECPPLAEIPTLYARRYHIEHGFRFKKQDLLWERVHLRTPERFALGTDLVCCVENQLYLARASGLVQRQPWESTTRPPTSQQVRRGMNRILAQLGTPAQRCQVRGNAPGWRVGRVRKRAPTYKVVYKALLTPSKGKKAGQELVSDAAMAV